MSVPLRLGRMVMLVLVVAFGVDAAGDLLESVTSLRGGALEGPLGAAVSFGAVVLAWWVWTLQRRLRSFDRVARTQAIAVHSVAAALWGLPLLVLATGLANGEAGASLRGADEWSSFVRDVAILAANLFVVGALARAKDCDVELPLPVYSPAPRTHAPALVWTAASLLLVLTAVHAGTMLASFRECSDCATGQIIGTVTAFVLSPLIVIACSAGILAAIGIVCRWRSARSLSVMLCGLFMLAAPIVDQILFGGIESAWRDGAKAEFNGELSFLVSVVNIVVMVLLTRPMARGWDLSRDGVTQVVAPVEQLSRVEPHPSAEVVPHVEPPTPRGEPTHPTPPRRRARRADRPHAARPR